MKTLAITRLKDPIFHTGFSVYLHEKGGRFAVHRVYPAGETSNAQVDGFTWHNSRSDAIAAANKAISARRALGYIAA